MFIGSAESDEIKGLKGYRRLVGRIKVLVKYPVGNGISVGSIYADDKLQELHRQLRPLPSYMYLTKRELELESVAHAYLASYPLGTKAQLNAVKYLRGDDQEDEERLRDLEEDIKTVLRSRFGSSEIDGYDEIIERISQLQVLEQQKEYIDYTLDTLEEYDPRSAKILRMEYVEGKTVEAITEEFNIAPKTFGRWRDKALEEYKKLVGMSENCPKSVS